MLYCMSYINDLIIFVYCITHTHTHTHRDIYIYIYSSWTPVKAVELLNLWTSSLFSSMSDPVFRSLIPTPSHIEPSPSTISTPPHVQPSPSTVPTPSHIQPSPSPAHASHQNPTMATASSSHSHMSSSPSPSSSAETLASTSSSTLDNKRGTKDTDGRVWIRPGLDNT